MRAYIMAINEDQDDDTGPNESAFEEYIGLDDEIVAEILKAEAGPWTEWSSVEEMMKYLDIEYLS
jgi:hypothetical protein